MSDTQPKGKPMSEIRRLVAEDQGRWEELAELWNELLPDEQRNLIETARVAVERSHEQRTR